MEIYIIATKSCSHAPNLRRELEELGEECEIKYVEDNPELVERFKIRTSPNLVVDDEVVFRRQPTRAELEELFATK